MKPCGRFKDNISHISFVNILTIHIRNKDFEEHLNQGIKHTNKYAY